ncbi:AAEL002314-PA [Aedes aegypti]|uniref:AAEL002314-PA n=1 Tax=Aedes aegypti TaxID=7159 RepID=Q17IL2_AEDAE|nr:AAEL002314-PA [Aedes aegypti]
MESHTPAKNNFQHPTCRGSVGERKKWSARNRNAFTGEQSIIKPERDGALGTGLRKWYPSKCQACGVD